MIPKISVVIPSYNKAEFIEQTLNSIFDQRFKRIEVIIQDGGSTDGTVEIIEKFVKTHPKLIKFVSKKDLGQCDAINKGFSKATGDIITFINADDLYKKNTFKLVSSAYQKNNKLLWLAGYGQMINTKGKVIASFWSNCKNILLKINSFNLLLLTSNYLFQPSIFLSRKAYEMCGHFDSVGKYVFEYDMWLKLGKVSMPQIIPNILSSFRISKNNMSSVYYSQLFKKDIEITKIYTKSFIVIMFHKLNNFMRTISILLINKQ